MTYPATAGGTRLFCEDLAMAEGARARSRSTTVACGGSSGIRRDRGACLTGYEPFHRVAVLQVMSPGRRGTG